MNSLRDVVTSCALRSETRFSVLFVAPASSFAPNLKYVK